MSELQSTFTSPQVYKYEKDIYLVTNKSDDYGNCKQELVETTLKNADAYYGKIKVAPEDVEVLKKYIDFVPFSEESERTNDGRFYGNE